MLYGHEQEAFQSLAVSLKFVPAWRADVVRNQGSTPDAEGFPRVATAELDAVDFLKDARWRVVAPHTSKTARKVGPARWPGPE
jgi:hypothetical protein